MPRNINSQFDTPLISPKVRAGSPTAGSAEFFLIVKGQKSGVVKGDVTQKGREGWIRVLNWEGQIISPRDSASGLPTGKRMHSSMYLRVPMSQASPILAQIICTNENLKEVTLKCFWAAKASGTTAGLQKEVYNIKLTNANIASFMQTGGLWDGIPVDELSMTYQKIEWTWLDGGITAGDDWETPNP